MFKVWSLARPYRARLFLGVLTGVISGLIAPLMIGTVMFVYSAVFPTADAGVEDLVLRPLSGKLMKETRMEDEGIVDRDDLLEISGRRRLPQFELAEKLGV